MNVEMPAGVPAGGYQQKKEDLKMKLLVISDDFWHPAEVVEKGLSALNDKYDITYVRTARDILTPEYLAQFPVVLLWKGNTISAANRNPWFEEGVTEVNPKEFREYVENGGGLIALHAGNTWHKGDEMEALVGNYFVGHPPRCPVSVHFEESPLTEGAEDFTLRDEHYHIEITADDIEVFAKGTSHGDDTQIAGYTRKVGKGKVVVFTPGHTLWVVEHPSFLRVVENAVKYCTE